jgi:acetyl/propionyl-CoA carboxylase alpha subunit
MIILWAVNRAGMKLTVKINEKSEVLLEKKGKSEVISLNGKELPYTLAAKGKGHFTVLINNKSIDVFVLKFDGEAKTATLMVNGKKCQITASDEMDALLKQLGMDTGGEKKMKELKAPMPGLVVKIEVTPGQEVAKDQPIVILEAMKMENVLKASNAGVVQSIEVKQGAAVEKNQVLIKFSN